MVLIQRRRVLAARAETVAYTSEAANIVAADAEYNVYDAIAQPSVEFDERPLQGTISNLPDTVGPQMGTLTFRTDFVGDGAGGVPNWASTFLPACGYADDGTGLFSPVTQSPEDPAGDIHTLTMLVYNDGKVKGIRGGMGNFQIPFNTGKATFIEFSFLGSWIRPFDAPMLEPNYPTTSPIRFAQSAFVFGANMQCIASATLDAGNEVVMRECQQATDASGYRGAIIVDRQPTIGANPESDLVANSTYDHDFLDQTIRQLVINLPSANDTITIVAPNTQVTNNQEGERNKLTTDELTFEPKTFTGDDEMTIRFS